MLFFAPAVAVSGPTKEQTVTLQFGSSQAYTHIFIKGKTALPAFSIAGIQAAFSTPTHAHGDVYGNRMPNFTDGSYNDLIDLSDFGAPITASSLVITFSGAVDIEEILVLNLVIGFEGREWNSRINYGDVETIPSGTLKVSATKNMRFIPPLNNTPDKFRIPCDILFDRQREAEYYQFNNFRREYRSGFVFSVDPTFYPELIAPVVFEGNTSIAYQARWKRNGRRVRFTVREV